MKLSRMLMAVISFTLLSCSYGEAQTTPTGKEMKIQIKFDSHTLTATLEDNATTRAIMAKMPMTLPMMNLYGREMCYRFLEALPTDDARVQGYEVGEIVYYPPMHSFVILYEQNGETFQMQKLGKVDSGVELFDGVGDIDVTFEIVDSSASVMNVSTNSPRIRLHDDKLEIQSAGDVEACLYDTAGRTIASTSGHGAVSIDCHGYRGYAVVAVNIRGDRPFRKKIFIG